MKKLTVVLMAVLAIVFTGCNKDKLITLSETSATLHHGQTYQIDAQCENPITYASADEYHAMVSDAGLVTANFIGNTTIELQSEQDSKTFSVTVEPQSNLYSEPNISFGESKNSVISKLGTPAVEMDEGIGYLDYATAAMMMLVLFDENNCVEYYALIINPPYTDELNDTFLPERYNFFGYQDGLDIYINSLNYATTTMVVCSEEYEDGMWIVMYMADERQSRPQDAINALVKALQK